MRITSKNQVNNFIKRRWEIILIFVLSLIISFQYWGQNLKADLWVIDDHEIIRFMSDDGKLPITEVPQTLLENTEIARWGDLPRLRPSYYTLRLLEVSFWGKNTFFWYLTRIFIFATSFGIIWYTLKNYFGLVYAGLTTLAFSLFSFWTDIFTRLGPSETYAVLGLALFILGFAKQLEYIFTENQNIWNIKISSFIFLLGGALAVGSKENLLFLPLLSATLFPHIIIKKKMHWSIIVSNLILIFYSLYIFLGIYLATSRTGSDIYQTPISFQERLILTYHFIPTVLRLFRVNLLLLSTLIFSILIFLRNKIFGIKRYFELSFVVYLAIFSSIALYLSQYFFYNGDWPTQTRYDFPGVLIIVLYSTLFLIYIYKSIIFSNFSPQIAQTILNLLILLIFIFIEPLPIYRCFKDASHANVIRTTKFNSQIESISERCKEDPSIPIILESYSVWDYEPIVGVKSFLALYQNKNPIYLKINEYSSKTVEEGQQANLTKELETISKDGGVFGKGVAFKEFDPEIEKSQNCIIIDFSGDTKGTNCDTYHI